jgi:hypothetical protein
MSEVKEDFELDPADLHGAGAALHRRHEAGRDRQEMNLSTSKVNRLIARAASSAWSGSHREPVPAADRPREALTGERAGREPSCRPPCPATTPPRLQQVGRGGRATSCSNAARRRRHRHHRRQGGQRGGREPAAERAFDVQVVPLTGGVQGKFYTDVNHLASRLAERLGGRSLHAGHAPLFAESREQRDMLMDMASVREVFDLAAQGAVALVGIGSIRRPGRATTTSTRCRPPTARLLKAGSAANSWPSDPRPTAGRRLPLNSRLVALAPTRLALPRTIGVAAGEDKVLPIRRRSTAASSSRW